MVPAAHMSHVVELLVADTDPAGHASHEPVHKSAASSNAS
jgi:hypothetical protein